MEPERQTPPPAPIPQITLPPLGSAPLPTLAGSPALPPADSMVPRRGGSVFWRVAALLVLGFLLLASLGPVFLLWNLTADSPSSQAERGEIELPAPVPVTESDAPRDVDGGAESFAAPTSPDAAPIVVLNFPAILYSAESVGWEYRGSAESFSGFCESELYRNKLGVPLAEWGTSVECVDAPTKFAVAAIDADLEIIACADWTGYARHARGITDDASCDFIDPPERDEARP